MYCPRNQPLKYALVLYASPFVVAAVAIALTYAPLVSLACYFSPPNASVGAVPNTLCVPGWSILLILSTLTWVALAVALAWLFLRASPLSLTAQESNRDDRDLP